MRLRGVPGGRAGLHVCTQREQPLRAVRGRELPVRGVLVRQHASCLHAMHACSGGGTGIQTGKNFRKWRIKWKKMRQTRKISTKLGKVVIPHREAVFVEENSGSILHPLHHPLQIPIDSAQREKTKMRGREWGGASYATAVSM
jgi:hypothetical protein